MKRCHFEDRPRVFWPVSEKCHQCNEIHAGFIITERNIRFVPFLNLPRWLNHLHPCRNIEAPCIPQLLESPHWHKEGYRILFEFGNYHYAHHHTAVALIRWIQRNIPFEKRWRYHISSLLLSAKYTPNRPYPPNLPHPQPTTVLIWLWRSLPKLVAENEAYLSDALSAILSYPPLFNHRIHIAMAQTIDIVGKKRLEEIFRSWMELPDVYLTNRQTCMQRAQTGAHYLYVLRRYC